MSRRRRGGGPTITTIYWRDIPAQVNGAADDVKVQRILPQRFHTAIDRAAMVANKADTDGYVEQWRKSLTSLDDGIDITEATLAAEANLLHEFSEAVLGLYVKSGGWNPDSPTQDPS